MSRAVANMHLHGTKMEALQPLRSTKDSVSYSTSYTSRPKERPTPSTPDFDRKKSPLVTSPLGKGTTRAPATPLVQSSQKPPVKMVSKLQEKESILEKRISQLKLAHETSMAQIETLGSASKKDDSFELQERKIRRETLLKDLLQLVAKKIACQYRSCLEDSIEGLRRNSQIYSIQLSCADEFREVSLKVKFLTHLKAAAEKYRFRTRLIRNFARVFERLSRPSINNALAHAFKSVQIVKRALHKTNMKQVKRGRSPPGKTLPAPTEVKPLVVLSSHRGDHKKSSAAINTSSASTNVTNTSLASASQTGKPKPKKDASRLATPVRPTNRPPKDQERTPAQGSTEKKTPAKSMAATQLLAQAPPVVSSPVKPEEVSVQLPPGPRTSAILIPCSTSISSRHQEMKKQLLRQIQGEDDEEQPTLLRESRAEWTPDTNTSSLLHNTSRLSGGAGLRAFCPEMANSPEQEKPNIFFHSLTDRPEEEEHVDEHLENKLSILMARKQFRRKA